MKKENVSKIFLILVVIYITLMLSSNILANRLVSIANVTLSGPVIVFPFTYVLGDIFTEVYGFKKNKLVIWLSFLCNLLMVLSFMSVINMPYPSDFNDNESFKLVLGTTPRVLIGSLLGFLIGGFLNSMVLSKLKVKTKGKYLALRTILSTIIGETADTFVFSIFVFIGTLPSAVIMGMVIGESIIKIIIEIVFTPVTYKIINRIKQIENEDTFDTDVKYKII